MSKKFWKWSDAVESNDSELIIEGEISSETWWGDESTPKALRDELKKHTGDLTVSLNSGGGDVFAGVSMYNALRGYDGTVIVRVDGLAASIASIIAMAGDKIIMSPGSMMMIHKPWTLAVGNSAELDKVKDVLNSIEQSMLPIYTARTGKSEEEISALLESETWMTAEQAVEMGFADELVEAKEKVSYSDSIKNLVNGQFAYSMKATEDSMKALVEKIKAEEEEVEVTDVPDTTETVDEVIATEDTETEGEIEPETEAIVEETETVVEAEITEPEIKDTAVKDIQMSEVETQAQTQVLEPQAQAPVVKAPKASLKAYLKTNEAMEAFAAILAKNPGEMGGDSSTAVRSAFKEHLEVKLGVTNPEIFLPTPLVTAIQNAFEDGGEIWRRVSKSGVDVWNTAWDAEDDVDSNDGRARGYNREDEENKAEQVLTFASRLLRPQFVYKYITLNKEDIKEQRSTGALVTYVLSELPQRIVREVERAIVLGDGRADGDDYKIQEGDPRGFYPIVEDATAGNFFGDSVVLTDDMLLAEAVSRAKDLLQSAGEIVLIAKKGFSTDARFEKNSNGDLLFPLGTTASDIFDVSAVIEPDWFNDTSSPDVDAIVTTLAAYRVVGDTTIEGFQNFILKTNKQEYLQEIWAGGGLSGKKSAVAIESGS